jgi:hypothetical protein
VGGTERRKPFFFESAPIETWDKVRVIGAIRRFMDVGFGT